MINDLTRWARLFAFFAQFKRPVVLIDLETTGGHLQDDRITEIAFLYFSDGKIERFEQLVNPNTPILPFIEKLTGISNEMVNDAPEFAELSAPLLSILRGSVVVAHNSKFDYTFLRNEFARASVLFAAPTLCTVQLSRKMYPQFHRHSLDSIIERCQIATSSRHRAMADVEAVADYLEWALAQLGEQVVWQYAQHLIQPKLLPDTLPSELMQQIYELSDHCGLIIWKNAQGKTIHLHTPERAFTQTVNWLHQGLPNQISDAVAIEFHPAVGILHAIEMKAKYLKQHGLMPSENENNYFTVKFHANEHGEMQARVVAMKTGFQSHQPCGFFLHKAAAKRAIRAWAKTYHLCPTALDILPETFARDVPCPAFVANGCTQGCRSKGDAAMAWQNAQITQYSCKLPVADWGLAHEIVVRETDAISGQMHTFRCVSGALWVDGEWYFDDLLPNVFKDKFKKAGHMIRVISLS